ncbi:MAG TPA: membrane protein insertion efficiency factor YidD [Firmicutes bacterium]|nr:membrane protein insertion efficiency factor YidD [Bacillota bacterium]
MEVIAVRVAVWCIKAYRRWLSPLKRPCCRYYPSCSSYAIEALEKYGIVKGAGMAVWRVLRCNPFGRGGYDPVR